MSADQEADAHAIQREKEREKRRLRDRQRRQNMSQEQKEKHLARRRKNYQLRRLKAQNNLLQSHQSYTPPNITSNDEYKINNFTSSGIPGLYEVQSSFPHLQEDGADKLRKYPRKRLRVSDIRNLTRRLHSDDHQLNGAVIKGVTNRRLRLTHVKRLARAIKLTGN